MNIQTDIIGYRANVLWTDKNRKGMKLYDKENNKTFK